MTSLPGTPASVLAFPLSTSSNTDVLSGVVDTTAQRLAIAPTRSASCLEESSGSFVTSQA